MFIIREDDALNFEKLQSLRRTIDELDGKIVHLLNERFNCCKEIAEIKKALNLNLTDLKREDEVLKRVAKLSEEEFADSNKLIFSIVMVLSSILQLRF